MESQLHWLEAAVAAAGMTAYADDLDRRAEAKAQAIAEAAETDPPGSFH
jgi:hypothetical protein